MKKLEFKVYQSNSKSGVDLKDILNLLFIPPHILCDVKQIEYNNVIVVGDKFDDIIDKCDKAIPLTYQELKYLANNVNQVEECELHFRDEKELILKLICFDSSYWQVETDREDFLQVFSKFA